MLEEAEKLGGRIDLKTATRYYFSDICEIHSYARTNIDNERIRAADCLTYWRDLWISNFPDGGAFVAACSLVDSCVEDRTKVIYLDPRIDEYLFYLMDRTHFIENMRQRSVAL